MSEEKIYLYPVWIRSWHMLNAILCLVLIVTGVSMQFSAPKVSLVRFDTAVTIHNIAGIILSINYALFFIFNMFAKNGKHYQIAFRGFYGRLMKQFRYYTIGIFKSEKAPFPITTENKFNPLQQFSYVVVMYIFVPLIVISGFALLYPEVIPTQLIGLTGLHVTDFIHILSGFCITMFMFIHVYFCTIGATPVSNFKSMINGYHESHD
jgi:thiosulfate reductase cytochrome b subunit